MALASFSANFQRLKGKGPRTVRICGQIYHNLDSLHPDNEEYWQHGQLYILDKLLRDSNPYVKSYEKMHEV